MYTEGKSIKRDKRRELRKPVINGNIQIRVHSTSEWVSGEAREKTHIENKTIKKINKSRNIQWNLKLYN